MNQGLNRVSASIADYHRTATHLVSPQLDQSILGHHAHSASLASGHVFLKTWLSGGIIVDCILLSAVPVHRNAALVIVS